MIGGDLVGERARLTPGKLALVDVATGARLTYRELDGRARSCARVWVDALGLEKGDRMAILAHNRLEVVDAFWAAGKTGVVLVPLGTRLAAAELEGILADCGAAAVLYGGDFAATVGALRERLPDVTWVALDEPAEPGDRSWAGLVAGLDASGFEPTRCGGEDVYCLLYTSGTTGTPKGVMIPHRQVAWNGYNTVASWQLRDDDVSPIFTPLYHAGGLMVFLVPLTVVGGTVVLHRRFDPAEVWRSIETEGCTVVLGVPTIWKMLLDAPELEGADLSRVRWFVSGGAPLPEYIVDAFQAKGVPMKQGFGMTEVGVNCFAMTVDDAVAKKGSIGKPMMGTEVLLVDEEDREVPAGTVGEMLFRGPHVCRGYWSAPEATAVAFVEIDGVEWFRSGDLARRDEDGFFYIAGRKKEMLISGGVNIFPAEIETALLLHPAIEDAALVGVPHEQWGEVGVAFVVPRSEVSAEDLAAFLSERLARFKIPKELRFVEALPRTPYGKVVKGELTEQYLASAGTSTEASEGGDPS